MPQVPDVDGAPAPLETERVRVRDLPPSVGKEPASLAQYDAMGLPALDRDGAPPRPGRPRRGESDATGRSTRARQDPEESLGGRSIVFHTGLV